MECEDNGCRGFGRNAEEKEDPARLPALVLELRLRFGIKNPGLVARALRITRQQAERMLRDAPETEK